LSQRRARAANSRHDLFAIQQSDRRAGGARVSTGRRCKIPALVAVYDSPWTRIFGFHRFRMVQVDLSRSPHDFHQSFRNDLLLPGGLACESRNRGFDAARVGLDLELARVRHTGERRAYRDALVVLAFCGWDLGHSFYRGLYHRPLIKNTNFTTKDTKFTKVRRI